MSVVLAHGDARRAPAGDGREGGGHRARAAARASGRRRSGGGEVTA